MIDPISELTKAQEKAISAALEKTFRRYNEKAGPIDKDAQTRDFVFHMTDWYDDLVKLHALFKNPADFDQERWDAVVLGFLNHAVAHMLAAAKLNDTVVCSFDLPEPTGTRPKLLKKISATP